MRRQLVRLGVALVALLCIALIGASVVTVRSIRDAFPQTEGQLQLSTLDAPVTVRRDANGIPQIYASNPEDLFRAQGYVHAQDRFFEMDFRRHMTSGRLSEWFGAKTLETDKFIRTLGWRKLAAEEYDKLDPRTKIYFDRYAEGVNAYLDSREGSSLSVEYTMGLLGPDERVDRWSAVDSLAWLKAMAWDLRSNVEDEMIRVFASTKVDPDRVAELYPDYPYGRNPAIVTDPDPRLLGKKDGKKEKKRSPGRASLELPPDAVSVLGRVQRAMEAAPSTGERAGIGSNSWVVAGSRTTTGKPLLANDPHLAVSVPSVWYQAGLHCRHVSKLCPFDVSGFTFSGVPGVVIGHNQNIAWGFTNLGADVSDLYLERIDGDSYLYDGVRRPLDVRREVIRVKGEKDVVINVRSTQHGPLLSDISPTYRSIGEDAPAGRATPRGGLKTGVALRWTALDPGRTADSIFGLNAATNWEEFRRAAARFEVPSQNLVYADRQGNIGYQAPGRIPVRGGGAGAGKWPAAGWSSENDWKGWIPFEDLPSAYNPSSGYIVTANNAVIGPEYDRPLADVWAYGYRSKRITDLLTAKKKLSVADMARIQLDTHNGFAKTFVPYLLDVKVNGFTRQAQVLLKGWKGEQSVKSAPAAYYNAVWKYMLQQTFADELPRGSKPGGGDRWYEVMRPLLKDPDNRWWDDVRTKKKKETRDDILRQAMVDARLDLTKKLSKTPAKWEWGRLHHLELVNPTYGTSGIGMLESFYNRGPYRVPGGSDAVLAASWNTAAGFHSTSYKVTTGPSMRMVVDMGNLDRSRWINLTGASGHPWHDNYTDQTELWVQGRTLAWPFGPEAVERRATEILTLNP